MIDEPLSSRDGHEPLRTLEAEIQEMARVHDVALDMIERSHDPDGLLDRILDEYEVRLRDLPNEALREGRSALSPAAAGKLRALAMFAAEAAALKQKAVMNRELRSRADALAESNTSLGRALADAEAARKELDGVLAALDAGILVLGPDGTVRHANPAGLRLAAGGTEGADRASAAILDRVPRGADAEVRVAGESGDGRLLMVARRDLAGGAGSEVVLLSDITQRSREIEERHRMEKLSEILRTLSILSHKINNPLTALLGRAQMLRAMAGTDPKVLKSAAVIEESAGRIAELIRELAGVVKEGRQEAVEKVLDVGAVSVPGEGAR
jgi:signal transduction histidine kinase